MKMFNTLKTYFPPSYIIEKNSLYIHIFQSLHMYFNTNINVHILVFVTFNKKQILSPCQVCDFSGLVPYSVGSIQRELVHFFGS